MDQSTVLVTVHCNNNSSGLTRMLATSRQVLTRVTASFRARWNFPPAVWGVAGFALLLYLITAPSPGYVNDLRLFGVWMRAALEHGVPRVQDVTWCDYPPGYLYLLWGLGKLWLLLTWSPLPADGSLALRCLLKVIPALAGVLGGFVLYRMALPHLGHRAALVIMAVYACNPALIFNGGIWGQADSLLALLFLLSLEALDRRTFLWAGAWLGMAILIKFQAVVVGPVLVLGAWYLAGWRGVGMGMLGAGTVAVVLMSPYLLADRAATVLAIAGNAMGRYPFLSLNAQNIWWFVGGVDSPRLSDAFRIGNAMFSYADTGLALFMLATALALGQCWMKLRRKPVEPMPCLLQAAALIATAFYLFPTQMHERYIVPGLALLAALCIWWRVAWWVYVPVTVAICFSLAHTLLGTYPGSLGIASSLLTLTPAVLYVLSGLFCAGFVVLFVLHSDRRTLCLTGAAVVGMLALGAWIAFRPLHAGQVSLETWAPISARQGWGKLQRNKSVDGRRLSIASQSFSHGLGTHAPSRIIYHLNGKFRRFDTLCGADSERDFGQRMQFRIQVDAQVRFDSGPVTIHDSPRHAAVDVTYARYLILEVLDGDDGNQHDHADWINPTLYRADNQTQPGTTIACYRGGHCEVLPCRDH